MPSPLLPLPLLAGRRATAVPFARVFVAVLPPLARLFLLVAVLAIIVSWIW
jgi:hypothetical protein